MKLYIILKSYNLILLNTFKKKFFNANRKNSLKLVKFAFLPKKQKIYTVNRSSHIYNLSKEKFEMRQSVQRILYGTEVVSSFLKWV